VLLINFLTDLPEMTIATDRVDAEALARPQRWSIPFIRRFMLVFGLLSSAFDYLTFVGLLWLLHLGPEAFRSGWFVESVLSAVAVVFALRTRGALWRSRPGRGLLVMSALVAVATAALPFTPLAPTLGFTPLPPLAAAWVAAVITLYFLCAEALKRLFWRHAARRA
jgi:Mg2+-importing ATPase